MLDLKFCECGGIMMPHGKGKMKCRSCGKLINADFSGMVTKTHGRKGIVVIEDNSPDLPKTDKECPKCGNKQAWYWLIQTRAADEPPTQFFKCTACKHIWREYK